jgi:hypothetical protein
MATQIIPTSNLSETLVTEKCSSEIATTWRKPDLGWHVLSVEASYIKEAGVLVAMIRDHEGQIISSAWDVISHCQSA